MTLEDIRRLVLEGLKFKVLDAKSGDDITRSILLQIILEQEERGQPILSRDILEQMILSYGETMQGFMSSFLEQSLSVFLKQQKLLEEQMTTIIQNAPASVFTELAKQNLNLWSTMQETVQKNFGLANDVADKSKGSRTDK